jgi:hypothetical protein
MRDDKPLCKVPIGIAYQRPLRTDQTYEEQFWQTKLLQDDRVGWRDVIEACTCALLLFAVIGGILVCAS